MDERHNGRHPTIEIEMNKAQALAIHCIDFRFQNGTQQRLEELGLTDGFDRISWPGASKDAENVTNAAAISIRLHNPDEVFIIEHEDCGAYGEDNSLETHRQNAEKLAQALREIKPSLKITPLIATFDGIKPL